MQRDNPDKYVPKNLKRTLGHILYAFNQLKLDLIERHSKKDCFQTTHL